MNTLPELCKAQQWSALFEALSDITFLEESASKDRIVAFREELRHLLYLAPSPLPQTQLWRHSSGATLDQSYVQELANLLWSYTPGQEPNLFSRLFHLFITIPNTKALAEYWARQAKTCWLRNINVRTQPTAPRWRMRGTKPVISANGEWLLLKTKDQSILLETYSGRELKSFATTYYGGGLFSPDSQYLATFQQKIAQLWHAASLSPTATCGPHAEEIIMVGFAPQSSRLALCSKRQVSLWKTPSGEQILAPTTPPIEHDLQSIELLSDELLLLRNTNFQHYVWSWPDNKILWTHKAKNYLLGEPRVSPKRDKLLLMDGQLFCGFAMPSGAELFSQKLPGAPHNNFQLHPTEEKAIVAAWSPAAHIVDTNTGQLIESIEGLNSWKAGFVQPEELSALSGEGLVTPRLDRGVHPGTLVRHPREGEGPSEESQMDSHLRGNDGDGIVTPRIDRGVHPRKAQMDSRLRGNDGEKSENDGEESRNDEVMFWTHSQYGVHLYNAKREEIAAIPSNSTGGSDEFPVLSRGGRYLLVHNTYQGTTALWETSKIKKLTYQTPIFDFAVRATPTGESLIVWSRAAFSYFSLREERYIKSIKAKPRRYFQKDQKIFCEAIDGGFHFYDTATGELCSTIPGSKEREHSFLLLRDELLFTSDGKTTWCWDPETGARRYEVEGRLYWSQPSTLKRCFMTVTESKDERGVTIKTSLIREIDSGAEVQRFALSDSCAISDDGQWFADYGSYSGEARLFRVSDKALRFMLKDSRTIDSIDFSEDGSSVYTWTTHQTDITSEPENVACEWSLETGERTSSNKQFTPAAPKPFIEGWTRGYRALIAPNGQKLAIDLDALQYHHWEGRHYIAGVNAGTLVVYEVQNT